MAENSTGMSGGTSYGGVNVGNNKGTISSAKVTGMKGGTAGTVIAAGRIEGGAGNQVTHQHGPTTNQDLRESQNPQLFSGDFKAENQAFGSGDINKGSSPVQSKTDPEDLTSEGLLALVRKRECSEETVKIFVNERVTGSEFMEDDILEQLNITNSTDVRKLTSLQKKLRNK